MRPIIGIHGIGSQPDKEILQAQWSAAAKQPIHMVYWADITEDNQDLAKDIAPISKLVDLVMKNYPNGLLGSLFSATVVKRAIKDVALYLMVPAIRNQINERFKAVYYPLKDDRPIIIGHSLGSVIAYEVLKMYSATCFVITLGSPLGMDILKEYLKQFDGSYIPPAGVIQWRNFADRLDPVAIDPTLADDFHDSKIYDYEVTNLDRWKLQPHSATGYLGLLAVRKAIFDFQAVG